MANNFFQLEGEQEVFKGTETPSGSVQRGEGFKTEQDFIAAGGVRGTDNYWENVTTITPESLEKQNLLDISGQPLGDSTEANLINAGAGEQAKQNIQDIETKKDTSEAGIVDLMTQLEGEGAEQLKAEKEAGIPDIVTERTGIQGEIKVKTAEFAQLQADFDKQELELKNQPGMLMGHFTGLRAKASDKIRVKKNALAAEIGILQAQDLALQGKQAAAQSSVNRAIDVKYNTITQKIETQKFLLDIISEDLSEAEQRQWDTQQAKLDQEQVILDEQKNNDKAVLNTLLSQMNQYPDAGIQLTDTLEEANAKITQNSTIYRQQTRLAPGNIPGPGPGPTVNKQATALNKELTSEVENLFAGEYGLTGGREKVIQRLESWARINYPEIVNEISKMVY